MKYYCLILVAFLLTNCNKDAASTTINCESLQQGLISKDVELVRQSLGKNLDMIYSKENLNQLAETISKSCAINAALFCFSCVYTNPPESEMLLTFFYNNDSAVSVIDISYTKDSTIKLVAVHE